MNQVNLIGRLAKDPDVKVVGKNGATTCRIQLAVDKEKGEGANFINVASWGKNAENCGKYLKKGSQIAVSGSYQTGSYEKDGEKKYTREVLASRIDFLSKSNSDVKMESTSYEDFQSIEDDNDSDVPF